MYWIPQLSGRAHGPRLRFRPLCGCPWRCWPIELSLIACNCSPLTISHRLLPLSCIRSYSNTWQDTWRQNISLKNTNKCLLCTIRVSARQVVNVHVALPHDENLRAVIVHFCRINWTTNFDISDWIVIASLRLGHIGQTVNCRLLASLKHYSILFSIQTTLTDRPCSRWNPKRQNGTDLPSPVDL